MSRGCCRAEGRGVAAGREKRPSSRCGTGVGIPGTEATEGAVRPGLGQDRLGAVSGPWGDRVLQQNRF